MKLVGWGSVSYDTSDDTIGNSQNAYFYTGRTIPYRWSIDSDGYFRCNRIVGNYEKGDCEAHPTFTELILEGE